MKLNNIIETYGLTAYDVTNASDQGVSLAGAGYVWNEYRHNYTDAETLAIDEAWAQRFNY